MASSDDDTDDESVAQQEEEIGSPDRKREAIIFMRSHFTGDYDQDKSAIDEFLQDYRKVIVGKTTEGTFLHTIVAAVYGEGYETPLNPSKIEHLFQKIITDNPDLLEKQDAEHRTPLYRAIYCDNNKSTKNKGSNETSKLVDYMLSCCKVPAMKVYLDAVLKKHCGVKGSRKTCLTLAFENNIRAETLSNLVNHASEAVLKLADESGRTPFHYAVNYEHCTDERVAIIERLIERDWNIVNSHDSTQTFLDSKYAADLVEYSVYREHERTVAMFRKKKQERRERRDRRERTEAEKRLANAKGAGVNGTTKSSDDNIVKDKKNSPEDQTTEPRSNQRPESVKNKAVPSSKEPEKGTSLPKHRIVKDLDDPSVEKPKGQDNSSAAQEIPNPNIKRQQTQIIHNADKNTKGKKPSSERSKNSAKVLAMLKLHYMRTRTVKQTVSFLYGTSVDTEKLICYEYEGPKSIKDIQFNSLFGEDSHSGLQFDEVLMYVRFPVVRVERTGRNAMGPTPGRQDVNFFFAWLCKKGVKRIIKLEVNEDGTKAHSDVSIQKSLGQIVVEHLDWRKMDLDPQVICEISTNDEESTCGDVQKRFRNGTRNDIRKLTLKWSGNNAVLRAWSEPEGLPQLPGLETIELEAPAESEMIDAKDWVQKKIEAFEKRFTKNFDEIHKSSADTKAALRKIRVSTIWRESQDKAKMSESSGISAEPSGKIDSHTEHKWLTWTDRFSGCMYEFWQETIERSNKTEIQPIDGAEDLKKPVIVALIDDGVDLFDPDFSSRSIEGKSFDFQENGVGQYYSSARHHGTEMARLIWRVCPMARIYSIRLKTHDGRDNGPPTIDANSAASAIEAALDKQASIISLSWTIPVPEDNTEKERLKRVLARAHKQEVLMFCSSSDDISDQKHAFSEPSSFFRIGAAHSDGRPWAHAFHNVDFIFPGVNVATGRGTNIASHLANMSAKHEESTGSSIATALAAGLAAMILHCFKASALAIATSRAVSKGDNSTRSDLVRLGDVKKIAKPENLKGAFRTFGKTGTDPFIPVWEKFQPVHKEFERDFPDYQKKADRIANFCAGLFDREWK